MKSVIHFALNLRSSDKLDHQCRECHAQYKIETNYHARYWTPRTDERRENNRNTQQTKQGKSRQKIRSKVYRGKILKPDHCEMCGKHVPEKRDLMAHHPCYDQPDSYIWICSRCHGILESVTTEVESVLADYNPDSDKPIWDQDFIYPITKFLVRCRSLGILESDFFEMLREFRAAIADQGELQC